MTMPWSRSLGPARKPLNGLLRTRLAAALVTPRKVDDYLALVDPIWSLTEVRARVTRIHWATRRAVSVWLSPNELWRGFKAGQHVLLTIELNGVRQTRCFSISSAPEDGSPLRLTIQVVPDGRVSDWVWQHVQIGDVVELSQAQGDFVLPKVVPRQLLFISAGSGITPLMSMIRHLSRVRYTGRVSWLHYARHETIFADELTALTESQMRLRLHLQILRRGEPSSKLRHFSELQLQREVPNWRECETYLCGPARLTNAVRAHWQQHGLIDHLHTEYFKPSSEWFSGLSASDGDALNYQLSFQKSGVESTGHAASSLLEQAEAAGLKPASGCRMGICHSCVCRKVSGAVRNEITGHVSSASDEIIQLCISSPRSDVVLDL